MMIEATAQNLKNLVDSGIVVVGMGCSPIGILASLLLSALLTLLANLWLRRRD